jgi:hypothetical protein
MHVDLTKLWPEVALIAGGTSDMFHGQISAFIGHHPTISMVAGIAWAIWAKVQPTPVVPPTTPA